MLKSARIFFKWFTMTQPSCRRSSPVMRVGSTAMTQRQNSSLRSGRGRILQDRRRRGRSEAGPRACLSFFFDIRGVVHREFVPQGQTVNAEFYCTVLKRLKEDIRRKRPELWRDGNWVLHHDNAPAHSGLKTRVFWLHQHNRRSSPTILARFGSL